MKDYSSLTSLVLQDRDCPVCENHMSKAKMSAKAAKPGFKAKRHVPERGLPSQKKSINGLKTKIRDTERLLKRVDDLPADVRVEKERALAGYKQDVESLAQEKLRSKMISKYHKVRFFERQKATRILKKLTRMLNTAQPEDASLEALNSAIANAQVDLNYTIYSPLMEKYQSLYAPGRDKEAPKQLSAVSIDVDEIAQCAKHRPFMWTVVSTCTDEGNLDSLREGRLRSRYANKADEARPIPTREARSMKKSDRNQISPTSPTLANINGEEDSDGAFFE